MTTRAVRITVYGIVQGVGFRPFVHRLATGLGLTGTVANQPGSVCIELLSEDPAVLDRFLDSIRTEAPSIARVDSVQVRTADDDQAVDRLSRMSGFSILGSVSNRAGSGIAETEGVVPIPADIATCPNCLAELQDPADRRYRYPFINCTVCGPRYTITHSQPYDRANTSMSQFNMCPECQREYDDPADRRFHAQPNACPECGPRVWSIGKGSVAGDDGAEELDVAARKPGRASSFRSLRSLARVAEALNAGQIVAVKGLGGYHLACDATDPEAVQRLRDRKRQSAKPFALMAEGMETVRRYCRVDAEEELLLTDHSAPIVILRKRTDMDSLVLPDEVAPGSATLGFMLPYTPLHHLLLSDAKSDVLVMTSGNRAEEPICHTREDAERTLSGIAEVFLHHDRDILNRADDPIVQVIEGRTQIIRRSRGYVPESIDLRRTVASRTEGFRSDGDESRASTLEDGRAILALGSDLKNSLCLLRNGVAIPGPHIGDLSSAEASSFLHQSIDALLGLGGSRPELIAHDAHPGFASTAVAERLARRFSAELVPVQHHHAHLASCLAENGHQGAAFGIALDGTGFGADGTVWGGEILHLDGAGGFTRVAHLQQVRMPGSEAAVRQPWRMATSYLAAANLATSDHPLLAALRERVGRTEVEAALRLVASGFNSPLTSSCGRLFDAVASLLGVCDHNSFEGEAAIALEAAAYSVLDDRGPLDGTEPAVFEWIDALVAPEVPTASSQRTSAVIETSPLIRSIVHDILAGTPVGLIALHFHRAISAMLIRALVQQRLNTPADSDVVALSGGVFQNRLLSGLTARGLRSEGFDVLTHHLVPPNDGGIALGQAAVAAQMTASAEYRATE